jgi:hypothetical protein
MQQTNTQARIDAQQNMMIIRLRFMYDLCGLSKSEGASGGRGLGEIDLEQCSVIDSMFHFWYPVGNLVSQD